MPTNFSKKRTPVSERKGIKISQRTRELYEQRNKDLDNSEFPPVHPDKWADAMRREEYFRPVKKQITMRLDADVLAWLKAKGDGHLTRINEILRKTMLSETTPTKR
jgi:uncharacterized protein (DUF4415 family)